MVTTPQWNPWFRSILKIRQKFSKRDDPVGEGDGGGGGVGDSHGNVKGKVLLSEEEKCLLYIMKGEHSSGWRSPFQL